MAKAKEYKPTELESKVLKALAAAEGDRMTVEELADRSGVRPDTVYKRLQNPQFREVFLETSRNSLAGHVPAVLKSFVDQAVHGSFQHGKLVLEIAGIHKEESTVNINAQVREGEEPFKTAEERREFLARTLQRIHRPGAQGDDEDA